MKKYFYVYKLTLPETSEFYYGRRASKCEPENDTKYLGSMQTWKPDKTKLVKEIIKECNTFEESRDLEVEILEKYIDDPLNRNYSINGEFHSFGIKRSKEAIQNLSQACMGRTPWNKGKTGIYSEETLQKMENGRKEYYKIHDAWNKGKTFPEYSGENNPRFGKTYKELYGEEKAKCIGEKISKGNTGKVRSEEFIQNLKDNFSGENHPMFGKHPTEETKQKIAKSLTGGHPSEETKRKQSNTHKNLPELTCPHCGKTGKYQGIKRYHMNNCKYEELT